MTPPNSAPGRIRFKAFEVDLRTEELFKSGKRIRLSQQSFRVLAMLLQRAGQLVTRDELRASLWPSGTAVEWDQGLNAAVNRLRDVLGDSAEAPRFIETLPKRGYRFIAAIQADRVTQPPDVRDSPQEHDGLENVTASEADGSGINTPAMAPATAASVGLEPASSNSRGPRRKVLFAAAVGLTVILLVALTITVIPRRPSVTGPAAGRPVVPFASLPGRAIAPTFSPDGSQIAFAWNGGEDADHQFDLYVKSLGSERLLRLTHHPSEWISPAWSPDGSAIAFVRKEHDSAGLFVIPALGGSERRIVSRGVALEFYIQTSWSPDGHQLAYSAYGPTGAAQVYLASLDTLSTQPLSPTPACLHATEPAFSPDGTQIALACLSSSSVYGIYVVGIPHGSMRLLASMMGDPQGLTWAADASRLVFSNDPGDGGELWELALNGRLAQLPFAEEASAPAVAARNGRMAYVSGRHTVDIWRVDLTARHPEESADRFIQSTRIQILPRYSQDGRRIAFVSNRSGSWEIWMMEAPGGDPPGGDPDRLTSFNGPLTSAPSWCSDGHRIAFDSRASGTSTVYIEDISERVPRKVITTRENLSSPAWSEDCRWLFAHDGKYVLYRFPSSGGAAERFTDHPSSYYVAVGQQVVFNVVDSRGVELWTKPANGGPEAPLENIPRLSYVDAWTATAAGIYYTDYPSKPISVRFYERASRTTRTLTVLKQVPLPSTGAGIAVSPDARWLLYSQPGDEQSEIMLVRRR